MSATPFSSSLRLSLQRRFLRLPGIAQRRWASLPDGLYVFTFHRIGQASDSAFDPNVFSCDARAFREHLMLLQERFEIIKPADLQQLVDGKKSGRYALLTFDDGYRDNFDTALPILEELGLEAIIFVATDMVGSDTLPWWDEAAFLLRHSSVDHVDIGGARISLAERQHPQTVREALRAFKTGEGSIQEKLAQLRESLRPTTALPKTRLIMNWEEIREAQTRGITIGSHTLSHPILAQLDVSHQERELVESRRILEAQLQRSVDLFAYPVGSEATFSDDTARLVRQAGYKFAFSTTAGKNDFSHFDALRLARIAVSTEDPKHLREEIILTA